MTRPTHIALILVVFSNGLLLAWWREGTASEPHTPIWVVVGLLIIASAAIHLANEAADHESDRRTIRTPFSGGSGALEASGLSPRVPLVLSAGLAALTAGLTLGLVAVGTVPLIVGVILLLGLSVGLAYSLPPLAIERRGWGEPVNAALGGMLLPLLGVATVLVSITFDDVVAFLPFVAVTFLSVLATAWPDRVADAAAGKATMQVRIPPSRLRAIAIISAVAFVASTVVSVWVEAMPLAIVGLLVTPLLVVGLARYTRSESPLANVAAMVGLAVITSFALIGGLLRDGAG